MFLEHLGTLFVETPIQRNLEDPGFNKLKAACISDLSRILQGGSGLELQLPEWINQNAPVSKGCKVSPGGQQSLKELCESQGWSDPREFTIDPVNSPACAIHWRVMGYLFPFLEDDMIDHLGHIGFDPEEPGDRATARNNVTPKSRSKH